MERIVVGTDGSEGARRALQWAIDEARRHGAHVECVLAWEVPVVAAGYPESPGFEPESLERDAVERLHEAVAAVDTSGLDSPVDEHVARGAAAHVIVEAAGDADLVVVGARGLGGFKGLLLGSVSQHVTRHAPCSVVVVPPG